MKLSRYTLISPDQFRSQGGDVYRCAYVSRTGTTFKLRGEHAAALEEGRLDDLPAALIAKLVKIEAVTADDADELGEIVERFRTGSTGARLRRFVILPTSYCNMGCSYCGQEHVKGSVTHPRVQQQIARVKEAIVAPDTTALHIMWFGGEPLLGLRVIREISDVIVPECDRVGLPFSSDVVTNGSLLSHRVLKQLYDQCRVRWIEVTVDGPRDTHNARRKMRNGTGTFDHIVNLLSEVVRDGLYPKLAFGIRTNVDSENEDTVPELIRELAARGLSSPRVIMKPAPVHSWGNDVSERELKRWEYAQQEMQWVELADELQMSFPTGLPVNPRPNTCLATTRSGEVIDSAGRIYSCTEHPLVPADIVRGQISSLDLLPPTRLRGAGMFDSWYDEVENRTWQCADCPFLPVCGGGCPKLWKEGELPCPSFKFTWVNRLARYARRQGLETNA